MASEEYPGRMFSPGTNFIHYLFNKHSKYHFGLSSTNDAIDARLEHSPNNRNTKNNKNEENFQHLL
jgi:hypothetical protein